MEVSQVCAQRLRAGGRVATQEFYCWTNKNVTFEARLLSVELLLSGVGNTEDYRL